MDINKPQPERFLVYNVLPDGKSFTIKDSKFIYKLDRCKGWRDQYGHYYNSSGEPDFEPEDADLTPEQGSVNSDSVQDEYEKLYGGGPLEEDSQEEVTNSRSLQKIAKNLQILGTYPLKKHLRVFFENMPYKTPPKQVAESYSAKIQGIMNIIFDLNQKKQRNGHGHFIMNNATAAEKLIKLQGEKVLDREVYFKVEKLEELIMDNIKQTDLVPFWNKPKPQYFNSQLATKDSKDEEKPVEVKTEKKNIQTTATKKSQNQQKTEKVVPQEKKQVKKIYKQQKSAQQEKKQLPQFINYQLNFSVFDTKTKFVNWMTDINATRDVDYKNIVKKVVDQKQRVTIDVRRSIVEAAKGKKYNGNEVIFKPTN